MKTLESFLLDELADLSNAELQWLEVLPRLSRAAAPGKMRELFASQLLETEAQLRKTDKVFGAFYRPIRRRKSEAMEGLIRKLDRVIRENETEPLLDAALIATARTVAQYRMASRGSLLQWAGELGNREAALLLQQLLLEGTASEQLLSALSREHLAKDGESRPGATEGIRP